MGMLPFCRKRPVGIRERRAWYGHLLVKRHVPRLWWLFSRLYFCIVAGIFAFEIVSALSLTQTCGRIYCKAETASMRVKRIAYSAYAEWAMANIDKQCPKSLADLSRYRNSKSTKDSWGNELVMECDVGETHAFVVISKGPDGKLGTGDDIRSSD